MKNELSTVVYKPNWKYLIDNCLNKELWGKSWVVYDYDNIKIILLLEKIDVENGSVDFVVRARGESKWGYHPRVCLPLSESHFNEVVFNKSLFSALKNKLISLEKDEICNSEMYQYAAELDYEYEKECREIIEGACADLSYELREIAIDGAMDNLDTNENRSRVLDERGYKTRTNWFLMLAQLFNDNEHYNTFLEYYETEEEQDEWSNSICKEFESLDIEEMAQESVSEVI